MDPVREADAVLRNRMTEASERIEDAIHGTREKIALDIQKHPMRTVLLSVGAGLLVGMLLGMGRRRRSD
jgi:ElaB/YqjD/DUF883 family membrane-anchored ribosome-binding protein